MRNYSKTVGALAVASLMVGHAGAEIEGQVGVGYSTDYIFRGANLGNDLIDASVDVGWDMGAVALSAGAWYGAVQEGFNDEELNETRVYGEAAMEIGGGFEGRVGLIYYQRETYFAHDSDQELYFGVSHELPFGITADLTYFWDISGDNDGYTELGLSKHIAINDCWSLDFGGQLGYMVELGGLSHATTKIALNYHLSETATVTGYVARSWELDEADESVYSFGSESNRVIGGLGLTVGF